MREKLFMLISIILFSGFISSEPLFADGIKSNKRTSKNNYKLLELKNNFLKAENNKHPVIALKTESTGMSKGSATWLGVGAGLVAGGATGLLVGSSVSSSSDSEQMGWNKLIGLVLGGISGAVIGGVVGNKLGK